MGAKKKKPTTAKFQSESARPVPQVQVDMERAEQDWKRTKLAKIALVISISTVFAACLWLSYHIGEAVTISRISSGHLGIACQK